MAQPCGDDEPEWIKRVKSEGAVPFLDPENCSNGWASPSGDVFMVRGPEYFSNKVKIPGGEYLLKPLGFDWIKGSSKLSDLLKNPEHRIRKVLQEEFPSGVKPFVWAINLQVPSKENYSAVAYFVALEPIMEGSLMDQYLKGDVEFKNSRLKLVANISKGPWIVKKAVGEQAICVIGRVLTCNYCDGDNFIEIDIDIGSSVIANAVVHLALSYLTKLTVDLAFLIESQTESELPERILGAIRFSELDPASAGTVELPPQRNLERSQSSLARLWKSLGRSFSRIRALESETISEEPNTEEVVDGEKSDETVNGEKSDETIRGEKGVETVNGEKGDETVTGEKGDETVTGEKGDETVAGEKGDETVTGEKGDDTFNGEKGDEAVNEEKIDETVNGEKIDETVNGEKCDEPVNEEKGDVTVNGEKGDETANGEEGDEAVNEGKSDKTVNGEKSDET